MKKECETIFYNNNFSQIELGKVCKTSSGGTPSRRRLNYWGGDIPWLKSGELNDSIVSKAEESITTEGLDNSNAKIFPQNTLLIALYGATVGKTGILGFESSTNQAICAIMPTQQLSQEYLHWFLKYKKDDFRAQSFGGDQPNISQKLLRKTLIPFPNKDMQNKIVSQLNILFESIKKLNNLIEENNRLVDELNKIVIYDSIQN